MSLLDLGKLQQAEEGALLDYQIHWVPADAEVAAKEGDSCSIIVELVETRRLQARVVTVNEDRCTVMIRDRKGPDGKPMYFELAQAALQSIEKDH